MTLSELLQPELVLTKKICSSKDELMAALLEQVYRTDLTPPLPLTEMLRKIKMREEIGGTLLPSGLSIPHAKLENFEGFILAIGTPAEPLFQQGLQVRLMALMITNLTGGPWYLPTMAFLTRLSRDADYFQRLCGTENYEDFMKILGERDRELA